MFQLPTITLKRLCRTVCVLAALLSLVGCFRGGGVFHSSAEEFHHVMPSSKSVFVQVAPVLDDRDPREVQALDRDFQIGSQATHRVARTLSRHYQSQQPPAGFEENLVILQARVLRWDAAISGGMLRKNVRATAQIELQLLGADRSRLYSARYQADTTSSQPLALRSGVESVLNRAMDAAVGEIFTDKKLFRKLNRASVDFVG